MPEGMAQTKSKSLIHSQSLCWERRLNMEGLGEWTPERGGGEPLENKVALVTRDPIGFLTYSENWPCGGYRSCLGGETGCMRSITGEKGGQRG